jgi:mRNA interferase MazF
MRAIHIVHLDKARPAVILTREAVLPVLRSVTVAPITTRIRGLSVEVAVGTANGLDEAAVINCDQIITVNDDVVGRHVGYLLPAQESELSRAIIAAFDLE